MWALQPSFCRLPHLTSPHLTSLCAYMHTYIHTYTHTYTTYSVLHSALYCLLPSGVGEQLPSLEDKSEPSTPVRTSSGDDLVSTPVQPLAREPSDEIHPFPTPRRLPKTLQPSNFYNGLESSAGAKLLMSPAVSKMKPSQFFKIRRTDSSHFAQVCCSVYVWV